MSLLSFSKTQELNLVFDISSGSIGGALVLKQRGHAPLILRSIRKNFSLTPDFESAKIEREMLLALHNICQELQKGTLYRPEKIYCVLATPWSHGEVRSIKYEAKTDFKFTEKLSQKLISSEVENFKKEWANLGQVIDRRVTKVALNGYMVDNPNGQKARSARIDVFLSLAPEKLIQDIEEMISKTFKARTAFTSQMFSDFILVRDVFDLQNDFLIINFGEEVSEVMIMKDDHLVGTAFFPYGKISVVRLIAKNLGKSVHETKSLLHLHHGDMLDREANRGLFEAVRLAGEAWVKELKNVLVDMVPSRHLPHHAFLSTDEHTGAWLKSHLGPAFFPEFTTAHDGFSVIIGDNRVLHSFAEFAPMVERDSRLTMKAVFINHL